MVSKDKPLFLVYTEGMGTEDTQIYAFSLGFLAGQKIKYLNATTPFLWSLGII